MAKKRVPGWHFSIFGKRTHFPMPPSGALKLVPPLRSRTAQNAEARLINCPKLPTPRGFLWAIGGSGLGK